MEVTHRSMISTGFAGGHTEAWFGVTLTDGTRRLVLVHVTRVGDSAETYVRELAMRVWNRMAERDFEAGLSTITVGGATITAQELKA